MASLAGALERCGTDVFKPTFSLTRESDRGFLLERERPWPTELGMLGLELPWIVGAREKITFTSDLFIRRTTGRKIGPHECVWEGMLSDLMLNWQCAVELAADEKPNGAPAQQANTDVDFRAPKGTERLFSDQVEIRREALWNLPPRSPEVARALLRAFEREEDLKAQLLLREILGTTISTKLRPHYWELDRWRELVKQNCDDPHLWPETSTPATEKAPADVQR
jgi:hypothetical protein